MSSAKNGAAGKASAFPLSISIGMYVAAVALSFVDLLFLKDVIGRVLNLEDSLAMLTSLGLGLVGIAIMTVHGIRLAHGHKGIASAIGHYGLWLLLGITFAIVRLFSAGFLGLSTEAGDEGLMTILGYTVSNVDIVMAPIMLILYVATGIMAKEAAKNILLSPAYYKWLDDRKNSKERRLLKEQEARNKAELAQQKALEKAANAQEEALNKRKGDLAKLEFAKTYGQALRNYNAKLEEIKLNYQKISTNIDYVNTIDKQENQFETGVKPSLRAIIQGSIEGAQNSVALAVRAKSDSDIQSLYDVIEAHNQKR